MNDDLQRTLKALTESIQSIARTLDSHNTCIKNMSEHIKLLEEAYWELKRPVNPLLKHFPWPKAKNVPDVPKGFDHPCSIQRREDDGEHKKDPQATPKQGDHDDEGHGQGDQG